MKKIILTVLILMIITGCNQNKDSTSNDREKSHETELEVMTTINPVHSFTSFNSDELIQAPYNNDLENGITLIFNSDEYSVLCYTSVLNDEGYIPIKIDSIQGIVDGKIVYKEYKSKKEYKVGLMNFDFSVHTEAIYKNIELIGANQAIIENEDGYGILDLSNGIIIPCVYSHKPKPVNNFILFPVEKTGNTEVYNIHNRADGQFLYFLRKTTDSKNGTINFSIKDSSGIEDAAIDISQFTTNELIPFKDGETGYYGFKNEFDVIIIEPIYLFADMFYEDFARVRQGEKWGFVDLEGNIVIV